MEKEFARRKLNQFRRERQDLTLAAQQLIVITDPHDPEQHDKLVAIGRKVNMWAQMRVNDVCQQLMIYVLSDHVGVHISVENALQWLNELAHASEQTTTVSSQFVRNKMATLELEDIPFYQEAYASLKKEWESSLLDLD